MSRFRFCLLVLVLSTVVISPREVTDPVAAERTRRAAYTRCLRSCDLSSQTATGSDKAWLKQCVDARCKVLVPDYSINVPPVLHKEEL